VGTAEAAGVSGDAAEKLYRELATAAESGWDFSSRWLGGGDSLGGAQTTSVVPAGEPIRGAVFKVHTPLWHSHCVCIGGCRQGQVGLLPSTQFTQITPLPFTDLNALLYQMECNIALMAAEVRWAEVATRYAQYATQRLAALNALCWNNASGQWHDLLIQNTFEASMVDEQAIAMQAQFEAASNAAAADGEGEASEGNAMRVNLFRSTQPTLFKGRGSGEACVVKRSSAVYASNWVPLYCGCAASEEQAAAAVMAMRNSGLIQASKGDSMGKGGKLRGFLRGVFIRKKGVGLL
jgi:alpha,alpha-trehalase